MKFKVSVTAQNDLPVWIVKEKFEKYVNKEDLKCRVSQNILDCYHPKWFLKQENGETLFIPPAFEFRREQFYGINGRHRAVLLLRHLSIIPLIFANTDKCSKEKIQHLIERKIDKNEKIEIPDLPINIALITSEDTRPETTKDNKLSSDVKLNISIKF